MTRTEHEFGHHADIRAALADPALVPELPAGGGSGTGTVAWLRSAVARFGSGPEHRRRRALVEAELARLEPYALRRAAEAEAARGAGEDDGPGEGGGSEADGTGREDARVRVVRALAEALGMPEPQAVAESVAVVAGVWFGGGDPAADAAVARLVALLAPEAAADAGTPGGGEDRRSGTYRGSTADRESATVQGSVTVRQSVTDRQSATDPGSTTVRESTADRENRTTRGGADRAGEDHPVGGTGRPRQAARDGRPSDDAALEAVAARIGLLVQACAASAALVEAAREGDAPPARVLREDPPVRTLRRVAVRPTRVAGREIAEGDAVLLDVAAAQSAHPVPLVFGAPPRVCPGRAHALALAEGLLRRPATPFARLHHRSAPLLLPNAWDHASAAALAAQGFEAVGTTSLGVAAAAGLPDGAAATAEATEALARRLGRGPFLLSVDAEGGFSDDPDEVAALAVRLHEAGAAGVNLEDGRPDGTLAPAGLHAAKIAAVKAAAPGLFVNARTDTHWLGREQDRTAERLALYEQAGADGVFAPGLSDPDAIADLVASLLVPLNILYTQTGPTLAELAALGVRRVSLGSLLYRRALAAAVTTALTVRDGRPSYLGIPSYTEVQALAADEEAPPR